MSKKCLSKFCEFENLDTANHCGKCGIDLELDEQEVAGRDLLYGVITEFVKHQHSGKYKELFEKLPRPAFDEMMKDYIGRMVLLFARNMLKEDLTKVKESSLLDIEKEKVQVLKSIDSKLEEFLKKY